MDDGTVLVGYDAEGRILAFDASHVLRGAIRGGDPPMTGPRGTTFTPDGVALWVTCRTGFVQRWDRVEPSASGLFAVYGPP